MAFNLSIGITSAQPEAVPRADDELIHFIAPETDQRAAATPSPINMLETQNDMLWRRRAIGRQLSRHCMFVKSSRTDFIRL